MNRTDAEINIIFLSANSIWFNNKTEDLWYNATHPVTIRTVYRSHNGEILSDFNMTQYTQDEAASPLACKVQQQFCNPQFTRETGCTPLGAAFDVDIDGQYQFPDATDAFSKRLYWFSNNLGEHRLIDGIINILGPQSLLSMYRLALSGTQSRIPNNQWMLDAEHWFQINLAAMQAKLASVVMGPSIPSLANIAYLRPNNTEEESLCHNQVMLPGRFPSRFRPSNMPLENFKHSAHIF
jgi:hypothetical protein